MSARLDHVVVIVPGLAAASREFAGAGFTVVPGGRHHATPTENALVCFADGTYLELLAARSPDTRAELRVLRASGRWEAHLRGVSAIARRFLPLLAGPDGVADWVLLERSLATRAGALRRQGIAASGPVRMTRERPDGEALEWELLLPEPRLHPFWIADRTARERRVPGDAASAAHANGASGIACVRLRAESVAAAALALGDTLGVVPAMRAGVTTIDAGGWRIEIVVGVPEGAFEVEVAGAGDLPPPIRTLGVVPKE